MSHKLGTFSKFPKLSGLSLLIFCMGREEGHAAVCGILVPGPGIEPVSPAVESQSLNHSTAREVLELLSFNSSLNGVRLFCDPMDYSLPGSSVHGILQARILDWVAIPSSKDTGVGSYFLLQGVFLTQGSNPGLLPWQVDSVPLRYLGSPGKFYPHLQYRDSNVSASES